MTVVTELSLPEINSVSPGSGPQAYHQQFEEARARSWLARSSLAYFVLDSESSDFFLRSKATAFPGQQVVALFGITEGRLYEYVRANILNLTGDKHRRLRALVGHAFTPRAADRWRPAMREFMRQLWDELDGAVSAEFVSAIAKPYTSQTIAAVLGAPVSDAPKLHHWSGLVQRQFDTEALSTQIPDIERAAIESCAYVAALCEERKARPADDLISMLVRAETEGDKLSHDECVYLAVNVLAAGVDTTQSQLSQALRLFAEHPDQWALLAAEPERYVPAAVQEALRFEPIVPITVRICLEDITHRDVLFPEGTVVAICAERANRGQSGGETFDITAERDGKIFTYGAGPHFCLGANVARAELEEALAFLAPRMPGLAFDGEPQLSGLAGIYGVESLPLRWT